MVLSIDIGQCIYCGRSDGRLDREHVLPYGLWHDLVLRRASCLDCAEKTSAIENRVLHEAWQGFRTVLGAPTRRKLGRPETFRSRIRREGEWQETDLTVAEYTGVAVFPILGRPAAFADGPDCKLDFKGLRLILATAGTVTNSTWTPASQAGAEAVEIPVAYDVNRDPAIFARLVAKVALGYAIAFFGPKGFRPTVTPAILGLTNDIGCWVGSPDGSLFDEDPVRGHRIRVGDDGQGGVIAGVQLFADSGAPEYLVLVGRL